MAVSFPFTFVEISPSLHPCPENPQPFSEPFPASYPFPTNPLLSLPLTFPPIPPYLTASPFAPANLLLSPSLPARITQWPITTPQIFRTSPKLLAFSNPLTSSQLTYPYPLPSAKLRNNSNTSRNCQGLLIFKKIPLANLFLLEIYCARENLDKKKIKSV